MFPYLPPTEPPAITEIQPLLEKSSCEDFTCSVSVNVGKTGEEKSINNIEPNSLIAQSETSENTSQQTLVISDLASGNVTRLVTQTRYGDKQEFDLIVGQNNSNNTQQKVPVDVEKISVVELNSDTQEYDEQQQVITAKGKVVMRFNQAILTADSLQVSLTNRIAVAEGNVTLTRGNQVLKGTRFEYFFFEDSGVIYEARGEVDQSTSSTDLNINLPTDVNSANILDPEIEQPLGNITAQPGYSFGSGGISGENTSPVGESGGNINKIRFEASRIEFEGNNWEAKEVRITNDPFSPPELEIRADTATLTQIEEGVSELRTRKSRVVFDQNVSLPIFRNKLVFDSRPRQPSIFQMGYDGEEKGGLFFQGNFTVIKDKNLEFIISPQYFIQKALFDNDEGGVFSGDVFGMKSKLNVDFGPRTTIRSSASLTSLDLGKFEDNFRANVRFRQAFGNIQAPYNLSLEYTYRDRFFNGSQGFQTVQSSYGGILTSPGIPLGDSGINLSFQVGVQNIEAETDRQDLLEANRENDRINLTRYQGAVALSKSFPLWTGKALPATREEGLRYSPRLVIPNLSLNTGITAVGSFYSNGDNQNSLSGNVGLQAQFGHFSRNFFDYTRLNVGYSKVFIDNESPFKFDRISDQQTLSFGISQQLFGPFLIGFQTYLNLDKNEEISTDYILEYSRRTYNIILRYNPVLQVGSIGVKISDFNWTGDTKPFEDSGIKPVIQGVER